MKTRFPHTKLTFVTVFLLSSLTLAFSFTQTGIASWYGPGFHGKKTASGEIYDMNKMTAAHKTLPLMSCALVTSERTKKSVWVRINDRGPYVDGRIVDLSLAAAKALGFVGSGTERVTLVSEPSAQSAQFYDLILASFSTRSAAQFFIGSLSSTAPFKLSVVVSGTHFRVAFAHLSKDQLPQARSTAASHGVTDAWTSKEPKAIPPCPPAGQSQVVAPQTPEASASSQPQPSTTSAPSTQPLPNPSSQNSSSVSSGDALPDTTAEQSPSPSSAVTGPTAPSQPTPASLPTMPTGPKVIMTPPPSAEGFDGEVSRSSSGPSSIVQF